MRDSVAKRRGYILTAIAGQLFVVVATRALASVMGKMREMVNE